MASSAAIKTPAAKRRRSSGGLRNPRRPKEQLPPHHHGQRDAEIALASTARREQKILERLQDEKFILKSELYQWLVEFEKGEGKKMDKKTVDRMLQKLQEQGQCKCIQINVPAVTNCGRSRIIQVVLQPSSQALNAELLGQVHDKFRSFELQIRGCGSSRGKKNDSCPVLDGVQRIEEHTSSEVQVARSEAVCANGVHLERENEDSHAEPENERNEDSHAESENEPGHLEEDGESHSLSRNCAIDKMKPERRTRFSWTDEADRQLVTQYTRYRAALGAKCHRVDWTSVPGLPAPHTNCRRRMSWLKRNTKFRNALMKLCNILGERYVKHLKENRDKLINNDDSEQIVRCSSKEGHVLNISTDIEHSKDAGFGLERWDDFDDKLVKSALEDVLRFKRMAKLEASKRVGSILEEWSNMNTTSEKNSIEKHQMVSPTTPNENIESPGAGQPKDYNRASGSHRFNKKLIKLRNGETKVGKQVYESLAVSNAVELLKLVFLSTTKDPRLPNSLEETLQCYSERDLFAAFSYLRDRKIMIGGSDGQPFQLSAQFLHSISRSTFPLNTGKRASAFSTWLLERAKDLMEEGINLYADFHCGDIFQLFSLVSSGKLSLSPCLPTEGVGEAEELQGLKRKAVDNESQDGQQVKKMKSLMEGELVSRREKGFPGIAVSVNCKTFLTANTLEMLKNRRCWMQEPSDDGFLDIEIDRNSTISDCLKERSDMESVSSIAVNACESPWEAMAKFAEHLMSRRSDEGQDNHFDSALLKAVLAGIQRAGDQGMRIEDFSTLIDRRGENLPDIIIDVLQTFGRVLKVNAFDSVRIVDAFYRSKYFLNSARQDPKPSSSTQSQERRNNGDIQLEKPSIGIPSIPPGIGMDATDELSIPILPWVDGDGAVNTSVYNGLLRRVLGIAMQNPGILEDDIICRMDVLNPQSCKKLLEMIMLEGHLTVRKLPQTVNNGPPALLKTLLVGRSSRESELAYRKHFFANPSSIQFL